MVKKEGSEVMSNEYQFKLNGVNVDPWVNRKLNASMRSDLCKLYDDCINGLEKIFSPYNATMCAHCDTNSKDANWERRRKAANKPDCGCCVDCAYNHGYARKYEMLLLDHSPVKFDEGVIGGSYQSDCDPTKEGWGYFDPETHSCKLPRHVRSIVCLRYFCVSYEENIDFGKDGKFKASSMMGRVRRLVAAIEDIREMGGVSDRNAREAQKTLRTLKIIPWRN